jgi:hypothetical protein
MVSRKSFMNQIPVQKGIWDLKPGLLLPLTAGGGGPLQKRRIRQRGYKKQLCYDWSFFGDCCFRVIDKRRNHYAASKISRELSMLSSARRKWNDGTSLLWPLPRFKESKYCKDMLLERLMIFGENDFCVNLEASLCGVPLQSCGSGALDYVCAYFWHKVNQKKLSSRNHL